MAEPISDEEFAENLRLRREFLGMDPWIPKWLWEAKHFAIFGQKEIEREWGKELTRKVEAHFNGYLENLTIIEEAFGEGLGEKGENMALFYQMTVEDGLLDAIREQYVNIDAWKKRRDAGYRRKIAGKDYAWLEMLDERPEWMERVPKGKGMGWKVSDNQIASILSSTMGDDAPDKSTINRERKRRLEAL